MAGYINSKYFILKIIFIAPFVFPCLLPFQVGIFSYCISGMLSKFSLIIRLLTPNI